jgi:hypothetical protein
MVHPREPYHFEVRISVWKIRTSLNVTGRSIYPRGSASIPSMTPWNGVVNSLSTDRGVPISSSVDA